LKRVMGIREVVYHSDSFNMQEAIMAITTI
jgi:hypothetical protein